MTTAGNTLRWGTYQPVRDSTYSVITDYKKFGSAHADAFNAVFADGTVRRIHYAVNLGTFINVCVRDDGQPVNLDDL